MVDFRSLNCTINDQTLSLATHTDTELLEAIRCNDEDAFAELFRRYWKKVHAMAYPRVRSEELTAEIVQDLFISLWDRRATHTINHLPSYLYTAVKNKVLNYMESQVVRKNYWNYCRKFIPDFDNTTENTIEFDELMEAIETGMQHLPEKSERIFRLHRLEGQSIPEIANALNLSEKAIEYHLTQSAKKLRVHLKDFIVTVSFVAFLFL